MCIVNKDFKLCTCGTGDELPADHWFLYREEKQKPGWVRVGSIVAPDKDDPKVVTKEQQVEKTLELLNGESSLFDFDYKPNSDDYLLLEIKGITLHFKYSIEGWREVSVYHTAFNHPEHQYNVYLKGNVKFSQDEKNNHPAQVNANAINASEGKIGKTDL